jgi:ubiquinone/menaquinone biosynthesis C-methylase UbiE
MTALSNRQFYDRVAGIYDQRYGHGLARTARQAAWLARLCPPGLLLDLGCGSGRMLPPLAKAGFRPVGLDCSSAMLARAKAKPGLRLVQADAGQGLPFGDACFDIVISLHASIIHLHKPDLLQNAIAEVSRVLKRGGIFVMEVPHPDTYPAGNGSGVWQEYQPGISCRRLSGGRQEIRLEQAGGISTVIRVLTPDDLGELLRGFRRVDLHHGFSSSSYRPVKDEVLLACAWR